MLCQAGKKCNGFNAAPDLCGKGTYSPGGSSVCSSCDPGKYNDKVESSTCTECKKGTYSVPEQPGGPITECQPCHMGKYSSSDGASSCAACNVAGVYQSGEGGTTCTKCASGFENKTNPRSLSSNLGYTSESDVCQQCPDGKYSTGNGAPCRPCEIKTYNSAVGQTTCTPCIGSLTTLSKGSTSVSSCVCPEDMFHEGSGKCTPCGSCLPNEYVKTQCGSTSDVQCEVCQSCNAKNHYVIPGSMCNGNGGPSEAEQPCAQCKLSQGCSESTTDNFQTLYNCYSGTVSSDTTVCMATATDPLKAICERGEYQVCFLACIDSECAAELDYCSPNCFYYIQTGCLGMLIVFHDV